MSYEQPHHRHEHGTMMSYVTGFILSLVFTFIPYYLVTSHKQAGTSMLALILGLALVQLIIQVTYFLHLGRGPKPRWELYFFLSTIFMILVVAGGSLVIIHNLHSNMSLPEQQKKVINDEAIYQVNGKLTGACQMTQANHEIIFKNGSVSPLHTTASMCDTLTFVNHDKLARAITFGAHPAHASYAGVDEYDVPPGKTKTFTLSDAGNFNFHDHQQPAVAGSFLVLNDSHSSYNGR